MLLGGQLTAGGVLSALATFKILQEPLDKTKYKNIIHVACSLKKDLELFSYGEQTIIGDRGINLSGG